MHVMVHALSCTNLSGRQVLCGHLAELLNLNSSGVQFTLLLHKGNADIIALLEEERGAKMPDHLRVLMMPAWTHHWFGRAVFERLCLPKLVREKKIDVLLTLSGGYIPGLSCRQITLALNPWALLPEAIHGLLSRLKARLQRYAYKQAVFHADAIGYGSGFMRDIYRSNAGRPEKKGAVVYPALGHRETAAMDAVIATSPPRENMTILCVSLMARHKDIATLIQAMNYLIKDHQCPARLKLVGGWADEGYRREIESLIRSSGLSSYVEILGHATREDLRKMYRKAKIYCLLSRSESFGIPSLEAQWMGTPVVAARGCAAPEVCGDGGLYVEPGDAREAARLLHLLITDEKKWSELSVAATRNARRFQYRETVKPLMNLLGLPK